MISLFLCFGVLQATAGATEAKHSLKLGVGDTLSGITAVAQHDTYYVPLRALAAELKWTLTGLPEGIQVDGGGRTLRLLKDNGGAELQDGTVAKADTFLQNGSLMVPLKISAYLGYIISFEPEKYLLRVYDASATLDDAGFLSKYKSELAPPVAPEEPAKAPAPKPGTTLYLTFDDGPSATTSELLDILDKYEVKATFFMLGPHMNSYPSQVKRIVEAGNGLGLHGMTHRKEKFYASASAALAEMNGDNTILRKITGKGTTLIRPPYGSKPYFTKVFRDKVLTEGYHLWDWNVDSDDWKYKEDSDTIYNTVMDQVHKLQQSRTNPVILMHDQKATLKVLPRLLETLKKEGYTFEIITKDVEPVNFWKDRR
ncbi:polysaccharide deacetylase family protein [Paenibacillus sp. sgz5001063]|uniref:polysaccharide deacetylase n=1 Tax=Paenibacillus sp. sgz5001063 TaxID=3242474 RepID=UPI0036D293BF